MPVNWAVKAGADFLTTPRLSAGIIPGVGHQRSNHVWSAVRTFGGLVDIMA